MLFRCSSRTSKLHLLFLKIFEIIIQGLPLEHPFETIKTRAQSELKMNSFKSVNSHFFHIIFSIFKQIMEIFTEFGFRGFYSGIIPNAIRVTIKQAYRWPMMIFFPNFFTRLYPKSLTQRFKGIHKISAGITIASIETFFVCPIERIKVFLMTRINKDVHFIDFFRNQRNYKAIFLSLFNGLKAQLFRQIISWTTFLYFENKFKRIARSLLNTPNDERLGLGTIFITSSCTGVVNILIGMQKNHNILIVLLSSTY